MLVEAIRGKRNQLEERGRHSGFSGSICLLSEFVVKRVLFCYLLVIIRDINVFSKIKHGIKEVVLLG